MFSEFAQWIKSILEQLASWIIDLILMVFGWFWDGLIFLLDSFGLATEIREAASLLNSLPDSVWYFFNFAQLNYGIGAMLVAYLIRFTIRRLPVVG